MKKLLLKALPIFVISSLNITSANAQSFAFINGIPNSSNVPADYISQSTPGSRVYPVLWEGPDGNLMLWSGSFFETASTTQYADIWKYNWTADTWSKIFGPEGPSPETDYGIKGTISSTNLLAARSNPAKWRDESGNLYIFGGQGYQPGDLINLKKFNDVWKFDITLNQWVWLAGSNIGGQPGSKVGDNIEDPANNPGARDEAFTWTHDGLLYLFGGSGFDFSGNHGLLNDVWCFNPATNQWKFIKGSTLKDQVGVYGSLGTEHPSNQPGSRASGASDTDKDGNLWMIGGQGYDSISHKEILSDLWKWNPATNNWTWMSGPNQVTINNVKGVRGEKEQFDTFYYSYAATAPSLWIDSDNTMNLFNGLTYGNSFNTPTGYITSEQWKYKIDNGLWAWVNGITDAMLPPVYGVRGVASTKNFVGSCYAAGTTKLTNGKYVQYGGVTFNSDELWDTAPQLNTLWTAETPKDDLIAGPATIKTKFKTNPKKGPNTSIRFTGTYTNAAGAAPANVIAAYLCDSPQYPISGIPVGFATAKAIKAPKPGKAAVPGKISLTINYPGNASGKYLAIQLDSLDMMSEKYERNNVVFVGPVTF